MTYKKAILEIELFDVEDVIVTSGASGVVPVAPPLVTPTPQPLPPVPRPEDRGDDAAN